MHILLSWDEFLDDVEELGGGAENLESVTWLNFLK